MSFGMILKNKRIECGMLQEDVAKRMGLSQKTISSWELDRTVPKLDDYAKLSVIFNCSIAELTGQKSDLSTLTVHDILLKLPDFSLRELEEIMNSAHKLLDDRIQIQKLQREKEEMEKRLMEYERRISALKGGDPNGQS